MKLDYIPERALVVLKKYTYSTKVLLIKSVEKSIESLI